MSGACAAREGFFILGQLKVAAFTRAAQGGAHEGLQL
jgi:hypothetical protein